MGVGERLSELDDLERLASRLADYGRVETLARVRVGGCVYPILAFVLGSRDPNAPSFGIVAGVHGLERIGTHVAIAYMTTLAETLRWDALMRASLETTRLVLVPLLNPGGMAMGRRSNPRGVDLMRNAPPHPLGQGTFLVGGQSLSPRLPWYRGRDDGRMETEASALCDLVRRELFGSQCSVVIDLHSGFGMVDRVWFPYARTRRPLPHLAEVQALVELLDGTLPNHVYRIEPQARAYTIAGDLWDHLYDAHRQAHPGNVFVPLTLEMGSWLWVRKNPRQVFDPFGAFNPLQPHRLRRILRRHLPLLDFLRRVSAAPQAWTALDEVERQAAQARGFARWFGR